MDRHPPITNGSRSDGFTLLELLLSISIVAVVLQGVTGVVSASSESFRASTSAMLVDDTLRRTMDRIVFTIRFCDAASIDEDLPVDSRTLTFERVTGWDGAEPLTASLQTISFDQGQVSLDGTVIAAGARDLTFNRDSGGLTIVLEYDCEIAPGVQQTRRLTSRVALREES